MHVIKYSVQTPPHYLIPIHAVGDDSDGATRTATQSSQPCKKEMDREDGE